MTHIELAFSQYGIKEISGSQDNPEVLKYFDALGFDGSKLKDETAWCSAFANWVCMNSGLDCSGKLNARSWINVGVEVTEPKLGDIVVFWRESRDSWKGHVAFYVNDDAKYVYVLGGNQSNQVKVAAYPKERLLTFRRLTP